MKAGLIGLATLLFFAGCNDDKKGIAPTANAIGKFKMNKGELKVKKRNRAAQSNMNDSSAVLIRVGDLRQLIKEYNLADSEDLVFFITSFDAGDEKRYKDKPGEAVNFRDVVGKSTVVVGYRTSATTQSSTQSGKAFSISPTYDFGRVCPPPPNCDCRGEDTEN